MGKLQEDSKAGMLRKIEGLELEAKEREVTIKNLRTTIIKLTNHKFMLIDALMVVSQEAVNV